MTGSSTRNGIWLSAGIFVAGFALVAVANQMISRRSEAELAATSAQMIRTGKLQRDARTGFQKALDAYQAVYLTADASGLQRAATEGARAVDSLEGVAATPGVSPAPAAIARRLAQEVRQFLPASNALYASAATRTPELAPEMRARLRLQAERIDDLSRGFRTLEDQVGLAIWVRLDALRRHSARMRVLTAGIFAATMLLATLLVNLTIRRSIIAPLTATQTQLARERDLLQILMDHIPDSIYFKDAEGRFIRVNRAQAALLGIDDPEKACGLTDRDCFDEETARRTGEDERGIIETGVPMVSRVEQLIRQDGRTQWVTATKVPVHDAARDTRMIVGISRDVTEWKSAVEALEKSEESFRLLFAAIPHAVWVYDLETLRFLKFNEAAVRQYGYTAEEFENLTVVDVRAPEEASRLRNVQAAGPPQGAWKHVTRDGRVLDVEVNARQVTFGDRQAVLAVVQDVTHRKTLELELQNAQRLEAVGQLAAGIAHEINTPVQFVADNLRFLQDAFKDCSAVVEGYRRLHAAALDGEIPPGVLRNLDSALRAADMDYLEVEIPRAMSQSLGGMDRVATIVLAMKEFAHPDQKDKAPADLNKALGGALIVARNELKYVADIETDFGDLPPVLCHLAELNQVFLNLLINAAHAIGEVVKETGGKGRITVRTRRDGSQAVVSISDTGSGIPEAIRSRIFDPFFTTKEVGRGTGQGLSIARAIVVEKHGGRIGFEPNPPRGTTFNIYLPIGQGVAPEEPEPAAAESVR